ncbi:MAG TPA: ECF transporter S component [Firmicutes bacterium]|nr:ECF transporter S component [Bacillota bacterium]
MARVAVFIALSAIGGFIKIPSPTGTVALDSMPGYLGALVCGSPEGAIIAALGHIFSAATVGFPMTLPIHLFVSIQMAAYAAAFGYVAMRLNIVAATVASVILNGIIAPALFIPLPGFGMAFFTGMVLPLVIGSAINVILAAVLFGALKGARVID